MPNTPDPNKSPRLVDTCKSRPRDSYDDLLSGNIISSPPHQRHPVAVRTSHGTSRGDQGPSPVTLFSIFTDSTASLQTKSHQINNQSTEAMLESDPHFPDESKMVCERHLGHESKPSLQPTDPGFVHVQSSTMREKLRAFWSCRRRNNVGRQRVVANVALAEALHEENPCPWSPHMLKLYFFLAVAFLSSLTNGYDASLMGGINNMQYYRSYGPLDWVQFNFS